MLFLCQLAGTNAFVNTSATMLLVGSDGISAFQAENLKQANCFQESMWAFLPTG
jgi:hypothetical protein